MRTRTKINRRSKPAPEVSTPDTPINPAPVTVEDLTRIPDVDGEDKPKRHYKRRASRNEDTGVSFGKLAIFGGEVLSKLTSLLTKQDAPLNATETEMLQVVGDVCGKYLLSGEEIDDLAPKYAKYAVGGMLALIVGVRAVDFYTNRKRLTAGNGSAIVSPEVGQAEYQG